MTEQIFILSDSLLDARQAKAHAEEALKGVNAAVEVIEAELITLMLDDELTSFKRNGVLFSLVNKTQVSAEPLRRDELWEKMRQQGYEHLFSINAQTLSGEIKRLMEENEGVMPAWLEGLVKQFEKPLIRVKR